jgi:hypothetical protein
VAQAGRALLEQPEPSAGRTEEHRLVDPAGRARGSEAEDRLVPGDRVEAVADVERHVIDAVQMHASSVTARGARAHGFDHARIVRDRGVRRPRCPAMTESIWFTDALMRIHISPEDTRGEYALIEGLAPSGHMPPPHMHEHDGEG